MVFRRIIFLCLFLFPGIINAAEFQPMGAIGIGGAGVARIRDGFAPYWNPAGLAFHDKTYSTRINVSGGVSLHNSLADNVEKLSDIDYDAISAISSSNSAFDVSQFGDAVKLVSILEDISAKDGALRVNSNAAFGNHIKRIGFGAYGTFEAAAVPFVDTANVSFGDGSATARTNWINATSSFTTSNGYLSSQRSEISIALQSNGFTAGQADNIINAAEAQLENSGIPAESASAALINMAAAFSGGTGGIDQNQSSVVSMGLGYVEIPLSYGHPINLGPLGKLGIGASIKAMKGRVYTSTFTIFNNDTGDIVDEIKDSYKDSTSWGVDVGALWKPANAFSVGVVMKNLNTPEFDSLPGEKVKIKPQARLGVAWDPAGWITFAGDLDLTENETLLPDYKSRHLGGGLELHPLSWFKLRGGAYKNIAEDDIGPVATAGITLGTKWVNFDVDGAYGIEQRELDGDKFPKEARVQANLNILF